MQTRIDLFGVIHKTLRARLFDLCLEVARADFSNPSEVRIALETYRRTLGELREHHDHEDTFVEPALRAREPAVSALIAEQHAAANAALAELDALVAALEIATVDERPAIGTRLCARYQRFLIDYLEHLDHEETVVNGALWKHFTDGELMALRGRLQASISPARFAQWLEIMLPAINFDERAALLRDIKASAPEPAFAAAAAVAARVLGSSGWAALRARLDTRAVTS
jgi:hypothetical protein